MESLNKFQKVIKTGEIKENEPLAMWTTWNIGGPARYFAMVNSDEAVLLAETAKRNDCPFFVLGGGSNLLVSDTGYPGLVIKIKDDKIKIKVF